MSLGNLKIGVRLGLGFGIIVVLLLVLSGVAATRLGNVADSTDFLVKDRLPKVLQGLAIEAAVGEIGKAAYGLILAPDASFAEKQKAEIAAARKTIQGEVEALKQTVRSAKGKELAQALATTQGAFFAATDEALRLLSEGKKQEAFTYVITKMRDARYAFNNAAVELVKLQRSHMDDSAKEAQEVYKIGLALILSLAALATLLAIGIAWWATRSVTVPIGQAVAVAERVAAGDLTARVEVTSTDETGKLLQALKDMNESLVKIVGDVRESAEAIGSGTKQIASGNADLSQRTEEQASSLEETASSMEELTSTVKQNAENARQANQLAIGASEVASRGGEVVGQVVGTMTSINESSKKIVDIIGVIDGIAFQTNILALNAAVEAARAGEQGRGFAVVATEVRNLAQRSAAAAKEIKSLIGDSVDKVEAGTKLVDTAGKTMEEIVGSVKRVTDIMAEITAASQEQSSGIEQVNQAVTQMDEVTQQNAALVEEAAAAAESLQEQAQNLEQAVSVFNVGKSTEPRVAQPKAEVVQLASARPAAKAVRKAPTASVPPKAKSGEAPRKASGGEDWTEF